MLEELGYTESETIQVFCIIDHGDFTLQSIHAYCRWVCVCVCLTPKTEISEKPQSRRCNDSATNTQVCLDGCHIVIFFKHVFLV